MSDYIPMLDCWHWQHTWSSPWTQQLWGGQLPATPPNAGFTVGPPANPPLTSIAGQPRFQTDARSQLRLTKPC